jgi:integration host factor subunit beta
MHEAELIVDIFIDAITTALRAGEHVELRGLGSFHLRQRQGRRGRNPRTGVAVDIPPKLIAYFRPGRELKAALAELEA